MANDKKGIDEKPGAIAPAGSPPAPGEVKPMETVTPGILAKRLNEPADQITPDPAPSAPEPGPEKPPDQPPAKPPDKPPVAEDLIRDYTEAVVSTLDVTNSQICRMIARNAEYDGSFTKSEHDKLIMVWMPVVRMYYEKIPILLVAGFSTVTVLGSHFIQARQARDDKGKDQKK